MIDDGTSQYEVVPLLSKSLKDGRNSFTKMFAQGKIFPSRWAKHSIPVKHTLSGSRKCLRYSHHAGPKRGKGCSHTPPRRFWPPFQPTIFTTYYLTFSLSVSTNALLPPSSPKIEGKNTQHQCISANSSSKKEVSCFTMPTTNNWACSGWCMWWYQQNRTVYYPSPGLACPSMAGPLSTSEPHTFAILLCRFELQNTINGYNWVVREEGWNMHQVSRSRIYVFLLKSTEKSNLF